MALEGRGGGREVSRGGPRASTRTGPQTRSGPVAAAVAEERQPAGL
jgi:hypothetical protein